jgi:hypothetical protein
MIGKGRQIGIDRNQIFCFCCEDQIENEFHFILVCPTYTHLRENYIHNKYYNNPTLEKSSCINVIQKRTDSRYRNRKIKCHSL